MNYQCSGKIIAAITALAIVFSLTPFFPAPAVLAEIDFGSVESAANESNPGNADDLTINKPSSTTEGDFLIAGIVINGGDEVDITNIPSGWTLIERTDNDDDVMFATYWKAAGASEPSSYIWEFERNSSNVRAAGGIIRYTGVDTSDPIDVWAENEGFDDIFIASSVTTTEDNERVVVFYAQDDNNNHPTPSDTTERYDVKNLNNNGPRTSAADFTKTSAGSTGIKSIDSGNSNENWIAQTVALRVMPPAPSGAIVIVKNAVPDDAQDFDFTSDIPGNAAFSLDDDADGTLSNTKTILNVPVGTYAIDESTVSGWTLTNLACDDPDSGSSVNGSQATIDLDDGETITCTFENTKHGSITILKETLPDNDLTEFTFTGDVAALLSDGESATASGLFPGAYTSTETVPAGWDLTDISCDDGESANPSNGDIQTGIATFGLDPGENIICTFTNTKRASFSLEKISSPDADNGSFQFDLTGPEQNNIPAQHTFNPNGVWDMSDLLQGVYSLIETVLAPPDWTGSQNISCNGNGENDPFGSIANPFEITLNPGEEMSCTVNNTQDALITGKKFEDMNADGIVGEDQGIAGWTIIATRQDDPETEDIVESGDYLETTDEDGDYILRVPPGIYNVCETLQENWFQSYPTASATNSISCGENFYGYGLTVAAGDNKNGNDFGNYRRGSISGYKWEDSNGDDERNWDEEYGLGNWTIELYNSNENLIDEATTNEEGWYSFENLVPGTYIIREALENGWTQTAPNNGEYQITLASGEESENNNFGNFRAGIARGEKWEDINKNGARDEGEQGLDGWIITAANGDLTKTATTTDNGQYQFTFGPTEMGTWIITEENRSGWVRTSEAESYEITVSSGMDDNGYDFGNWKYPVIKGYKYEDADADGQWDDEEQAVSGWAIALGLRGEPYINGEEQMMIPIEIVALSLTGSDGKFSLTATSTGNYEVFEESQNGWIATHPSSRDSFFDIDYRIDMNGRNLNVSSFFDVFIESLDLPSNAAITTDINENPLQFGNQKLTIISGETATSTAAETTSFIVTWTTDKPATSRVIYDTISHPILGDAPNYGYASSTIEQDIDPKVTEHSVAVAGLTAGTTYYYRAVSAASPESVGAENSFTTPSAGGDEGVGAIIVPPGGGGGGGGYTPPISLPITSQSISTEISYSELEEGPASLEETLISLATPQISLPQPVSQPTEQGAEEIQELTMVFGSPVEIPPQEFGAQFAMASILSAFGNFIPLTGNVNFDSLIFLILLFAVVYSAFYLTHHKFNKFIKPKQL